MNAERIIERVVLLIFTKDGLKSNVNVIRAISEEPVNGMGRNFRALYVLTSA